MCVGHANLGCEFLIWYTSWRNGAAVNDGSIVVNCI